MKWTHAQKRFMITISLSVIFGFVSAYTLSKDIPLFWGSSFMWNIVTSITLTGLSIGYIGVYQYHPIFGFKINPFFRGAAVGVMTSIPFAFGLVHSLPDISVAGSIFGRTIITGIIYGIIIDIIATKYAGEGKKLLKDSKN